MYTITNKCIILDLDQTLVSTSDNEDGELFHTFGLNDYAKYRHILTRCYYLFLEDHKCPGIGSSYPIWGIKRPNLDEFLTFCFKYFKLVIVWSAGQRCYVDLIIKNIFKNHPKPHLSFAYDFVDHVNGSPIKSIPKLIRHVKEEYPQYANYITLENTFEVDDIHTNFTENPCNGILIPEYDPKRTIAGLEKNDTALQNIMDWLSTDEVKHAKDVRKLNKTNIFT